MVKLNTTYPVSLNNEIGTSGYKPVFLFCYSGTSSNHCTYHVVEKENMGYPAKNQYGNYTAYDKCLICNIDWRNSLWSRSTHEWTFTGRDGYTYKFWQTEDKSFWYQATSAPPTPTMKLISPIGSNPTEQTCENIIALVQDGKKYWLSQSEYVALGSPAWEEVSMNIFNSYPDGKNVIVVNGVTITVKDTNILCGITPPPPRPPPPPVVCVEGTTRSVKCPNTNTMITQKCVGGVWTTTKEEEKKCGMDYTKYIILIVIIGILYFSFIKKG